MEKKEFTVYYNGRDIPVTALGDNTFTFQISYIPVYVRWAAESDGQKRWVDTTLNQETLLSKEIGKLVEESSFL